jgi:hypothetical protein
MHTAVALARWLSGDDAAIALLERKPSFGRGPTPGLLMGGFLSRDFVTTRDFVRLA